MSKIGKLPIEIPAGVTVTVSGQAVSITGPKGTEEHIVAKGLITTLTDNILTVTQEEKTAYQTKALFGLTRALLANIVKGVSTGFEKRLEMTGVGYRAQAGGQDLTLNVGYSHPVKIKAPQGVQFAMDGNIIVVSGMNKALVGNTAAQVRSVRPPEPYKGKGIRYEGEYIRRKAGKAAKAVGGAK